MSLANTAVVCVSTGVHILEVFSVLDVAASADEPVVLVSS